MIPINKHEFDPRLLFQGLQDGIYFDQDEVEDETEEWVIREFKFFRKGPCAPFRVYLY